MVWLEGRERERERRKEGERRKEREKERETATAKLFFVQVIERGRQRAHET